MSDRRRCLRVCIPCKRAKSACESARPCPRCVRLGKEAECIDSVPVERKRKKRGATAQATASDARAAPADASAKRPRIEPPPYPLSGTEIFPWEALLSLGDGSTVPDAADMFAEMLASTPSSTASSVTAPPQFAVTKEMSGHALADMRRWKASLLANPRPDLEEALFIEVYLWKQHMEKIEVFTHNELDTIAQELTEGLNPILHEKYMKASQSRPLVLDDSKTLLPAIYDTLPIGVVITNMASMEAVNVYVNKHGADTLGYSVEELLSEPLNHDILFRVFDTVDWARFTKELSLAMAQRKPSFNFRAVAHIRPTPRELIISCKIQFTDQGTPATCTGFFQMVEPNL